MKALYCCLTTSSANTFSESIFRNCLSFGNSALNCHNRNLLQLACLILTFEPTVFPVAFPAPEPRLENGVSEK